MFYFVLDVVVLLISFSEVLEFSIHPRSSGRPGVYGSRHRAKGSSLIHACGQIRITKPVPVFGLWGEAGVPGENPCTESPQPGFKPRTFLV